MRTSSFMKLIIKEKVIKSPIFAFTGYVRPGHYHDWLQDVTGMNFDWSFSSEDDGSNSSEEDDVTSSSEEDDVTSAPEEDDVTSAPEEDDITSAPEDDDVTNAPEEDDSA